MPLRNRRWRTILLHIIFLPTLLFVFSFFTLGPKPYTGVDEAVVEKIAREHGREASKPFLDPGEGDLLLFAFLIAGVVGGFTAGYSWRTLTEKRKGESK
jgi:ABC-type cobalt transport system substrate-binding protein